MFKLLLMCMDKESRLFNIIGISIFELVISIGIRVELNICGEPRLASFGFFIYIED